MTTEDRIRWLEMKDHLTSEELHTLGLLYQKLAEEENDGAKDSGVHPTAEQSA